MGYDDMIGQCPKCGNSLTMGHKCGTEAFSPEFDGSATKVTLVKMFEDHYWDSLESDKEIVLAHIYRVMEMYKGQFAK